MYRGLKMRDLVEVTGLIGLKEVVVHRGFVDCFVNHMV
jgi:hypothetical protein